MYLSSKNKPLGLVLVPGGLEALLAQHPCRWFPPNERTNPVEAYKSRSKGRDLNRNDSAKLSKPWDVCI